MIGVNALSIEADNETQIQAWKLAFSTDTLVFHQNSLDGALVTLVHIYNEPTDINNELENRLPLLLLRG